MAQATFGAGCFWGVEVTFRNLEGVTDAVVGYSGGHTADPTYEEVCSGRTGHAEAVQVTYSPEEISYETLLDTFFTAHDPTQVDRQGPDVGTQYRSVIFAHDEMQRKAAEERIRELDESGTAGAPIATEVVEAGPFYPAEEYHQRYLVKRGLATCRI